MKDFPNVPIPKKHSQKSLSKNSEVRSDSDNNDIILNGSLS
jgi:hypothetical protein